MLNRVVFSFLCLIFCSCSSAQTSNTRVKVFSKSVSSIALPSETGDFKYDMLNMVNVLRAKGCSCGGKKMPPVPLLTWNGKLEQAAILHSADMAKVNRLDHIGSDGSEIDNRAEKVGYIWRELGENIAVGQTSITQVIRDWLKSPSHCQQLMSNHVTEMGVAQKGKYWAQEFGKPR
jgi:uncharacterized protein YkwD